MIRCFFLTSSSSSSCITICITIYTVVYCDLSLSLFFSYSVFCHHGISSLSPSLKSVLYMEKHRLSPLSDCSCCFLLFFSFFFYYVVLEWCTLSQMVRLYSGQVVVVVVSSLVVGWLVVCDEMIHMVKKRQCCTSQRQFAKKSR